MSLPGIEDWRTLGTSHARFAGIRTLTMLGAVALQMALLFQVVLSAVHVAREVRGQAGVVTSAGCSD